MADLERQRPQGAGLIELAWLLARQLGVIVAITVPFAVVAVVISLLLPLQYTASVQMLPSRPNSAGKASALLGSVGQGLPLDLLGMGGGGDAGLLVGLLQSRTVADETIAKFDLGRVYQARTPDEARLAFAAHVKVGTDRKTGIVTLAVEDRVPARARDVANAMAEAVNRLNNQLEMGRAGQERRFLEKRLEEVKRDLAAAEIGFRDYKARHGVVEITEQTKATVRAVASLRGEIMSREVSLGYLQSFGGADEQNTARVRREVAALRRQVSELEQPTSSPAGGVQHVLKPVGDLPQLGLDYLRLYRDLKIQETLYELLMKQHEMAKINEVRDTANAQVIDSAVLPTKKSGPKRGQLTMAGMLLGLMVALVVAWIRDNVQQDPTQRARWEELWRRRRKRTEHPPEPRSGSDAA
ncbi:MAG TPA: GNVR domain-containing protein [Polyangia bacterium]|jgi:uncharacterized protein involved in exopolysaccharide biosynthesis